MKRKGFTLIEILVVIGIIMLLMGVLVVGFRHINRSAAIRETNAELKVCKGMLLEFQNHNGLASIEYFSPQVLDDYSPQDSPQLFPVYVDPAFTILSAPAATWPSVSINDLGSGGSSDMSDRSGSARYKSVAVARTIDVIFALAKVPANGTELHNLPTKRILEAPSGGWTPNKKFKPPATTPDPIVVLDGWGNPIIFVPAGGLHITISTSGAAQNYLVRSTGTVQVTGTDPPMSGSERPFFASAGQDGDFTKGEDNVYSFEQ